MTPQPFHSSRQTLVGLGLALGLSLAGAAPTPMLAINYANAGVTSALVATCLAGSHQFGDTRGCDGSITETAAKAGDVLFGEGHAVFPGQGVDTMAWGRASFGALGAFAQSVDTNVLQFLNTQSRGASYMSDFIVASNGVGAPITTYQYTITVHGSMSPEVGSYGSFPYGYGSVVESFNAASTSFCPSCDDLIANWSSESGQANDKVLTGTFSMAADTTFQMRTSLDVSSYINVFPGQSAMVTTDYGSTLTLQLNAITPGANTLGVSGHDYAATGELPEPAPVTMTLTGLTAVAVLRRRRRAD